MNVEHARTEDVGPLWLAFFTPIHQYPVLADRKAAFLLSATGLILTVLIFFSQSIVALMHHRSRIVAFAFIALVATLVGLLAMAAWCSWRGFVIVIPSMPASPAFFADIARTSVDEYGQQVRQVTDQKAIHAILHYNYSLSQQSAMKFRLVNRSFAFFRVALVLWMALLLIVSVAG